MLGFLGALRRSELAALRVEDITRDANGLRLTIRSSKTDPEGAGAEIAIPEGRRLRASGVLDAWLARAGISGGWLFPGGSGGHIHPITVARVVQRRVAAAGYDPGAFGGHSLRAGFITSAAHAGASIYKVMEVSRHRSPERPR